MSPSPRAKLWAPAVAYMAVIFVLSSIPNPPTPPGEGSDKWLHMLLYAGLAALVVRALAGGWRQPVAFGTAALAAAISALYGLSDELHQHFVPPRQMDALDVAADAAGAAIAAALLWIAGPSRRP